MIARLTSLGIFTKIAIACFIPLAGLVVFAGMMVMQAYGDAQSARAALAFGELAKSASLAIHELQKERGMSSGFVASKGADFKAALPDQRAATDRHVRQFRAAVADGGDLAHKGPLAARLAEVGKELDRLDALRRSVSELSVPAAQAAGAYTRLIASIVAAIEGIGELSSSAAIVREISVYTAFIRAKELAGQERATGTRGFASARFSTDDLRAFVALGAAQDQQFDLLRKYGSAPQQELLKATLSSPIGGDVAQMREAAVLGAVGQPTAAVTPAKWFQAATTRIDQLKTAEDHLAEDLRSVVRGVADSATQRLITLLAMAAGLFLFASLATFLIGRAISRPLTALTGAMNELAAGNFAIVLPGLGRKDEVGQMAHAVEGFKVKAAEKARQEAEAKGMADQRAAAERKAAMHRLAGEFEQAVGNIVETVSSASTELEAAAGTLTKTAETTQQLSATVAAASEEASTNVASVASATNEMSSSVNEISRQVQESSRIANEAVQQAEKTDARITELSHAAGRIGDVVKLITAIAEQTNLLALNATIEAARAGESGRGFAVVAQEVKALAAQTGKATGEISAQISGMQAATQDSVAAIKEIGGTIGRIAEIASTIAAAVEEQGAATQEIARNVTQAAQGTNEVATHITDVNRGAAETGSASAQVLSSAQSLASESNHLKLEVEKFLITVRAA